MPVALLPILRASDVSPNIPPCLANNFHGIFGQQSIFKISDFACFDLLPASVDEGSVLPLHLPEDGPQQLVWLQQSSIDDSLRTREYEAELANFDARVTVPCVRCPSYKHANIPPKNLPFSDVPKRDCPAFHTLR
ncbi:hypothetical protein EDD15DRAFT_2327330, partial [Pisolithus albus]